MEKIPVTVTTCKRPNLFIATIDSLFNCNLDNDLIDKIILVDDGSTSTDIDMMVSHSIGLGFNTEVSQNSGKGHQNSLNYIMNLDYDYIFHIEDDWLFLHKFSYIRKGIEILKGSDKATQVVFSKEGRVARRLDTPYVEGFIYRNYDEKSAEEWPPFTLNPSIQNLRLLKNVGEFKNPPEMEKEFALRCYKKGYSFVFSESAMVKHIGSVSAYSINCTKR